jgi:hypothetical protein
MSEITGVVEQVSQYGVKVNGGWLNPSKFVKNLPKFEKGKTYKFEMKTTTSKKNGQEYTNIVGAEIVHTAPLNIVIEEAEKPSAAAKDVFGPIKSAPQYTAKTRDFDAEARGKTRCAIYAAAVTGMAKTIEEAIKISDAGVLYAFSDKQLTAADEFLD